jgi:hypothetical protein
MGALLIKVDYLIKMCKDIHKEFDRIGDIVPNFNHKPYIAEIQHLLLKKTNH